jgi:hypothetical protein
MVYGTYFDINASIHNIINYDGVVDLLITANWWRQLFIIMIIIIHQNHFIFYLNIHQNNWF